MTTKNKNLSLIIPAYNEENRIRKTLERYTSYFDTKKLAYEIIVVLNKCTDNTEKIVDEFKLEKIVLDRKGKGLAVMEGFKKAKGKFIGFTDADGSASPEEFYRLYKALDDNIRANGIVGIRKGHYYLSSFLFKSLVWFLFNLGGIKDTQCAVKIFDKETAKMLSFYCIEPGWTFDIELLHLCKEDKRNLMQVPITWEVVEGSKLSFGQGVLSAIELILYRFGESY